MLPISSRRPSTAVEDQVDRCSLPVVVISCPYRILYEHEVGNLPVRGTGAHGSGRFWKNREVSAGAIGVHRGTPSRNSMPTPNY